MRPKALSAAIAGDPEPLTGLLVLQDCPSVCLETQFAHRDAVHLAEHLAGLDGVVPDVHPVDVTGHLDVRRCVARDKPAAANVAGLGSLNLLRWSPDGQRNGIPRGTRAVV